jgi:hypothetical protein
VSPLGELAVDKPSFGISGRELEGGVELEVVLRGHADTRHKVELDRFLTVLASEASRLRVRRVRVDLRRVELMNSSCIKGFVNWIGELQEQPPERRYQIHFLADPMTQWQRRTLQAFVVFGGDLIEVAA